MSQRRKQSSRRLPRRDGRTDSTAKAEKRADDSGAQISGDAPEPPRKKIADLSDEERKAYFREKKEQSRARSRETIECSHQEDARRWEQREEMRSRRYPKERPLCYHLTSSPQHPLAMGFQPYMGKRFSPALLTLRELIDYQIFPQHPVLVYYTTRTLLKRGTMFLILTDSELSPTVDNVIFAYIAKRLRSSAAYYRARQVNPRDAAYRWIEVPVQLCRGNRCPVGEHGGKDAIFCHHPLKDENRFFYIPCPDCLTARSAPSVAVETSSEEVTVEKPRFA